jgi:hypothetical protein
MLPLLEVLAPMALTQVRLPGAQVCAEPGLEVKKGWANKW